MRVTLRNVSIITMSLLAAISLGSAGCTFIGAPAGGAAANQRARTAPGLVAPRRIAPVAEEGVLASIVQLNWTAVPGANSYQVYLGVDSLPPMLAEVHGTSIVVRDLPTCTTHYWRIVAVMDDGSVSSPTWKFKTRCE